MLLTPPSVVQETTAEARRDVQRNVSSRTVSSCSFLSCVAICTTRLAPSSLVFDWHWRLLSRSAMVSALSFLTILLADACVALHVNTASLNPLAQEQANSIEPALRSHCGHGCVEVRALSWHGRFQCSLLHSLGSVSGMGSGGGRCEGTRRRTSADFVGHCSSGQSSCLAPPSWGRAACAIFLEFDRLPI